ncbi:hypothetical protein AB6E04_22035 [Vibrio amylolyticus]|uniref:hypothetical protein n=1 Tax=Vibrio amylolyticus TaxID=2847292 RepID=UPI00354FDEBC
MSYELDLELWANAVGRIVTSLARVEGELLLKYESSFSRQMYFKDTLEERIKRLENLYIDERGHDAKSEELFKSLREHIKLRNLVAHNPIYYCSDNESFTVTNGQSKNKFINVAELEAAAIQLFDSCLEFTIMIRTWR